MKDIWRLLKLFKPYAAWMLLGAIVSLAATIANITLMAVSGWFITAMGLAGVVGLSINYFTPAAIIRACAIVRTGGRYLDRLLTHEATFRLIATLRCWFFERLIPLSQTTIGFARSGDLLSRMRSDIDTLERFYLGLLVPASVALGAVILLIFGLGFYSVIAAMSLGATLFIAAFIIPYIGFYSARDKEEDLVNRNAQMRASLATDLQGLGELLIYDQEGQQNYTLLKQSEEIRKDQLTLQNKAAITNNMTGLLAQLSMFAALLLGVSLYKAQSITAPDLVMMALLALACFEAAMTMPAAFQKLGGALRSARRIFDLTDQSAVIKGPQEGANIPQTFSLSFEKVTFSYAADHPKVLEDVSFTLNVGEKLAITGPTGAGKSSIVNLLLRFYDPQGGQVKLGAHNIKAYMLEDLRAQFATLEQSPHIFNASLRENLMIGNPEATQKDIESVCEKAGLRTFIEGLEHQYDTLIGEHGRALSGGQVKRLALARVLLKNAPCIILDEPGEGLDYEMEEEILSRVISNLNGAPLILISHRRIALDQMDKIITLD